MSTREAGSAHVATDMETLFSSSGQLGADLSRVDWEATPLGNPASWPQSLRTVLHVLLTSRFAMWMAWGPELTFFANEKYRRDTLGAKYPWALGRPAREVWAEIWSDIGPRIDTVMRSGVASWDESLLLILERSGYPEETYHTFSYSPLSDEAGEIAGFLCVVSEETERVVGERRMAVLRNLGAALNSTRTEEEVLQAADVQLASDLQVLPFSLVYLFDESGESARLVTAPGVAPSHPIAVELVKHDETPWPLRDLLQGKSAVVDDLAAHFAAVPAGGWPEPPTAALAVPLLGQHAESADGFLVAGLNRYRPLDEEYEGFLALLASQLAASLANAKAYEEERRRAEELAELDRAKTAFFTNVSHEFRTPLTLLLGPTSDALNDPVNSLAPEQKSRLEMIHRNSERLLKLVNTLLDFSRLEAGSVEPHFEAVDLAAETREVVAAFRPAVERAGLSLQLECEPLGEVVFVDREMWVKILSNLLSNALKFTFEGGITVRLSRRVDPSPAVELEVRDTGIGIEEPEQRHLFERFHRVSGARSRTFEGSGIGLALVAELAELHRGTVRASSEPGTGSTFTVSLPLGSEHLPDHQMKIVPGAGQPPSERVAAGFVEEATRWLEAAGTVPPVPEPEATSPLPAPERPRVLVVDDNADMRRYISSLLETSYEVVLAADGRDALAKAQARLPDLVLTDVMMPNLDGFGLVAELRADPVTAKVPIVMLSARAGADSAVEGLEAGADDYLIKPFSAMELVARVRSNLELERARREATRREHLIAAELQKSLVPERDLASDTLEIASYYQAGVQGTLVGGDWYDVIDLGLGRTALVIGDVMGRGIKAAAVMGQLRSAIRAFASMDLSPADVLDAMESTVRDLDDGQIVTCFYAIYDPADHVLEYANAGHLPGLVVSAPGERAGRLDGPLAAPLGSGPTSFSHGRVRLGPGATLLLYTDGLVERRGEDTDERIDMAARIMSERAWRPSELAAQLVEGLCPEGSADDIALLVAQVPSSAGAWLEAVSGVPSDQDGPGLARRFVAEALAEWSLPLQVVEDAVLVTSELVTNAILHGRPPVELRLRRATSELFIEVLDGAGYIPRNLHALPSDEHGRGLRILKMLARHSGFRLTEGGKCVWCTLELPPAS